MQLDGDFSAKKEDLIKNVLLWKTEQTWYRHQPLFSSTVLYTLGLNVKLCDSPSTSFVLFVFCNQSNIKTFKTCCMMMNNGITHCSHVFKGMKIH